MPYPTKYARQFDYQSYQISNPTRPLPGDKVNVDLNGVKHSITEIVDFLKGPIRSDGKLANSSVDFYQLSPRLQSAGLAGALPWITATTYPADTNVIQDSALYRALSEHTSGDFAADLAAGKWLLVADLPRGADGVDGTDGEDGAPGDMSGVNNGSEFTNPAAVRANIGASPITSYATRATAAAATISISIPTIWIDRFSSGTPFSRAPYKVGTSTGPLAFQDLAGNWRELDLTLQELVLTPAMFGAPNNGVDHDDTALRAMAAALQLGICKRALFRGQYKIFPASTVPSPVDMIGIAGVDGLQFNFVDASFTTAVSQTAQFAGSYWAANVFHLVNCKRFKSTGIPRFLGDLTFAQLKTFGSAYGTLGFNLEGNCSQFDMDGAEGQGVLTPFNLINDINAVKFDAEKPIIASKGSGYTAGQTLLIVGGAGSVAGAVTIDSVDGSGGINGVNWFTFGNYPAGTIPDIHSQVGYTLAGGSGSGARAFAYLVRFDDTQHTRGGDIRYVKARSCFYGYVQRDSGDNVTAKVDAEFCYRATFVYGGIIGARIWTTMRHIYRTAVIFGSGYSGLGNIDNYFHIKTLPHTEPAASFGDIICRPTFNVGNATKVSMHLDIDLDYGNFGGGKAANFMEISKYSNGVTDNVARGHNLKLRVTGRIKGKSDLAAQSPAGTHITMAGWTWTGEQFGGWEIGPLEVEGGGNFIIDPRAFPASGLPGDPAFSLVKTGIHFDINNPEGYVVVGEQLSGGAQHYTMQAPITVTPRSRFLNRYGTVGIAPATIGCLDVASTLNLTAAHHNNVIKLAAGTGAAVSRFLPANPFKGMRHEIQNLTGSAGTIARVYPTGATGAFLGHAVGKYLDLVVGVAATVECVKTVADNGIDQWAVVSTNGGTLTYQA